jgi:hypothetical protein
VEGCILPEILYMGDTASRSPAEPEYPLIAVAGYVVPSSFLSYRTLVTRYYPHKHILSITPSASETAEVLDVERYDASPDEAGEWVRRMIEEGIYRPCIYAQESNMSLVIESLRGIPRAHYRLWVAAWDGIHDVPPGYDAHQFYGTQTGSWDYSIVNPDFFPEAKPRKPHSRPALSVHPKTAAATAGGALLTVIVAALSPHTGVTPTEGAGAAGLAAAILAYLKRS